MFAYVHIYTQSHGKIEGGQRLVHRRGLEFHTVELILPFIYLINTIRKMRQISIFLRINPIKLKCRQESYQ